MKKYLLLLLLPLLAACVNELPNQVVEMSGVPTSTVITADMAVDNLNEFLVEYQAQTRSTAPRKIAGVVSKGGFGETRAEGSEVDEPLYHIVCFEDNQGYAVMSGDNRIAPVLSFVEQGSYDPEEEITDVRLLALYSDIDIMYRMAVGLPIQDENGEWIEPIGQDGNGDYIYPTGGTPDTGFVDDKVPNDDGGGGGGIGGTITYEYTEWQTLSSRGSILPCKWGQSVRPYDTYLYTDDGEPAVAGCVATAVAQIMYYWGHDYTYDGYTFDWDLMRQHISSKNGENCEQAYAMIAELFLKLGLDENLDMNYGEVSSGASSYNVPRTFENFGYASGGAVADYDYDAIYNVIATRPVYVDAYNQPNAEGHAWVIDNILSRSRIKRVYWNGVLNSTSTEYQHLMHCNMGWNGTSNGYYYSGNFDVDNPVIQDAGTTPRTDNYNFQYNKHMITGIRLN